MWYRVRLTRGLGTRATSLEMKSSGLYGFITYKEGFYLPAIEAMAMGHIPIGPACVGNRDYCKNGYNSLIPE